MTAITSISDGPNVSSVHVWKSIKKRFSFANKKIQLYSSTHALLTIQLGGASLKLLPLIGVTTTQRLCLEAWNMKALDKSVETLGLWIVTSRLHSLNLQTRVASDYVWRNYFLWLLVIFGNYPSDAQTIPTPRDNWFTLFSVLFVYLFFM